jgi:hypothetical protein
MKKLDLMGKDRPIIITLLEDSAIFGRRIFEKVHHHMGCVT